VSAKLATLITLKRREDKLSQTQLGEILDVDQTTVSNYERGAGWPSPNKDEALARWLGMPRDDLTNLVKRERLDAGVRVPDDGRAAAKVFAMIESMRESIDAHRGEIDALPRRVARLEIGGRPPSGRAAPNSGVG
jgi:transcriptional regulator with XRE-family HTH domain